MDVLRQDLRFALRLLFKDKAFAATTVLTLAICIGANGAIFTVVQSVLMRPLPYPDADRIVTITDGFPGAGVERAGTSVPNYYDRVAMKEVFDSVALYQNSGYRVGQGAGAEGVPAMNVSPSFFAVLRTPAVRGRVFLDSDGQVGHERVTMLSYAFAKRQPGGLDGVVGRDLRLNDVVYTVVGVLPETFSYLDPKIALFVPLAFKPEERGEDRRYSQNHQSIGRLAGGATIAQARARIDAVNEHWVAESGPMKEALKNTGYHTMVFSLGADLVRNVRAALQLLWGGVILVLLIAGVNITNLSLVRATSRVRELATRHALGAARSRVTRQLVTETLLLTAGGGALGLALGYWSLDALAWAGLSDLPRAYEIRMDGTVIAFTLGISMLLGVVVGAVPAMQMAGVNLSSVLREPRPAVLDTRAARSWSHRWRWRSCCSLPPACC